MNNHQKMVKEFMQAMQPEMVVDKPQMIDSNIHDLRYRLIEEELIEYDMAENIYDYADAIADLLYVVYGAAVAHGIDIEPVFEEVHRANMEKLKGPKRADGKQLKPEGWQPPDIERVIKEQM